MAKKLNIKRKRNSVSDPGRPLKKNYRIPRFLSYLLNLTSVSIDKNIGDISRDLRLEIAEQYFYDNDIDPEKVLEELKTNKRAFDYTGAAVRRPEHANLTYVNTAIRLNEREFHLISRAAEHARAYPCNFYWDPMIKRCMGMLKRFGYSKNKLFEGFREWEDFLVKTRSNAASSNKVYK